MQVDFMSNIFWKGVELDKNSVDITIDTVNVSYKF